MRVSDMKEQGLNSCPAGFSFEFPLPTEDTPSTGGIDARYCSYLPLIQCSASWKMDVRNATQPDMSVYPGIDMSSLMGSFFWGALFSQGYGLPLTILIGTLVSML